MLVYKVLTKEMKSTSAEKYFIQYKEKVWNYPHEKLLGSKLFVFRDLEDAKIYASQDDQIWLCKADGISKIALPLDYFGYLYPTNHWEEYWKTFSLCKKLHKRFPVENYKFFNFGESTLSCNRLKLIKRIY